MRHAEQRRGEADAAAEPGRDDADAAGRPRTRKAPEFEKPKEIAVTAILGLLIGGALPSARQFAAHLETDEAGQ